MSEQWGKLEDFTFGKDALNTPIEEDFTFGKDTPDTPTEEDFTFGEDDPDTPSDSPATHTTLEEETLKASGETAGDLAGARSELEIQQLRQEINFPPEWVAFFEQLFQKYSPEIDSGLNNINSKIDSIINLSYEEIVSKPAEITLTGEFLALWSTIQNEVSRIHQLGEEDEVSISNIPEILPEWEELIFTSKKEAILYLYWSKLVLKETENIIQKIVEDSWEDSTGEQWGKLFLNYWPYIIWWYIMLSTLGSMRRGVRVMFARKLQIWNRISTTNQNAEDKNLWVEASEYERRVEARNKAKNVFDGDDAIIRLLSQDNAIRIIDSRIEWLEKTDSDGNTRPNSMFSEASYWRKMKNIIHQRWFLKRWFDIVWKIWYLDSSDNLTSKLNEALEVKNKTLEYFRGEAGKSDIEKIFAYLELSHEVPNGVELSRRNDLMRRIETEITQGKIPYIFWMKTEKAIQLVKLRLIQSIQPNTSKRDITRILWDGKNNDGEGTKLLWEEVRDNFKDISRYENGINARQIQANLSWEAYNARQVRTNLEAFLDSVKVWVQGEWENRYNFRTASLVVEKILEWESVEDAIKHAFETNNETLHALITERSYIETKNNYIILQLSEELKVKIKEISTPDELKDFKSKVINQLLDREWKLKVWFEWFGQDILDLYEEVRTKIGWWAMVDTEILKDSPKDTTTTEVPSGTDKNPLPPLILTEEDRVDLPKTPETKEEIDPLELQREKRDFMYRARAELYLRDWDVDPKFIPRYISLCLNPNIPVVELQNRILTDTWKNLEVHSWENIIWDFIDQNKSIDVLFPGSLKRTFSINSTLRSINADIELRKVHWEARTKAIKYIAKIFENIGKGI